MTLFFGGCALPLPPEALVPSPNAPKKEGLQFSHFLGTKSLKGSHLKSTHLHKQWNGIESSYYNSIVNIPSEDVESSGTPFHDLFHADALLREKPSTSWHSEQQSLP